MKKSKLKQGLVATYIVKEIQLSELDFVNRDIILGKKWSDDNFDYPIKINKTKKGAEEQYSFRGAAEPVFIDTIMDVLVKLKTKGCNFVEIMNHSDHHGYHINGLEIHKASQEEIKKYEEEVSVHNKTLANKKIKELTSEIQQITKKYLTNETK